MVDASDALARVNGAVDNLAFARPGLPQDALEQDRLESVYEDGKSHPHGIAVAQNGDVLWYSYSGNGEHDPSGALGWHPNSGNPIGNGWQNFRHIHGSSNVFCTQQKEFRGSRLGLPSDPRLVGELGRDPSRIDHRHLNAPRLYFASQGL